MFVKLERKSERPAISAVTPAPTTGPAPLLPPRKLDQTPSTDDDPGSTLRTSALVVGSAGLASIGVGIWMSLRVNAIERDIEAGDEDPALRERGRQAETLQWVGYGVGGAALAGAGILYYLGHERGTQAGSRSVSLSIAPATHGAVTFIRWRL
jgi:hypothetical protein